MVTAGRAPFQKVKSSEELDRLKVVADVCGEEVPSAFAFALLVVGESFVGIVQNDVLERELLFSTELDKLKSKGMIDGYVATVSFVPPTSQQDLSRSAAASLLHYLDDQRSGRAHV